MDERTQHQIALNETRLRDLNGRNVDATTEFQGGSEDAPFAVVCECAHLDCETMFEVPLPKYREVRGADIHFLLAPAHLVPGAERLVEDLGEYGVAEKVDHGAEVARDRA